MKAYNVGRWIGGSARSTVHYSAYAPVAVIVGAVYTAEVARDVAHGVAEGWKDRGASYTRPDVAARPAQTIEGEYVAG